MIVIDNKYELMNQMSHDEKYDIWEAFDLQLERKIIVEIFHDSKLEDKVKKYVQLYAKIKHPNLMSVYTAGMFKSQPYIVFEYVEGKSISKYTPHTINDWKILALFFKQIVDGLYALHEKKMGHYHLTIDNILICPNNEAMLLMNFPKYILEEQHLFLADFDDIIALGEILQTFLIDQRVPQKLLEIAQKAKQCKLAEYTISDILHDLDEFLSIENPRFVNTASNVFSSKSWIFLGIFLVIFSCCILKYAYDRGAFIKEADKSEIFTNVSEEQQEQENIEDNVQESQELANIEEDFQEQQVQENVEENFQEQQEDSAKNVQTQQKTMQKESDSKTKERMSELLREYYDLLDFIEEKQKEVEIYSQKCEELEKQQNTFIQYIAKSQSNIESLLKQKDSLQNNIKALEIQINLKKSDYQKAITLWNKYPSALKMIKRDIEKLQDEIDVAYDEQIELERELDRIKSKRYDLEFTMASDRSEMTDPNKDKKEIAELKKGYNKDKLELKQLNKKIQRLEVRIERYSIKIRKLEEPMPRKQEYCKKLESIKKEIDDFETKQDELGRIKKEIDDLSAKYDKEKDNKRSLSDKLNDIQTDLLIRKEYSNSLQNEIKDAEFKVQQLKDVL